MATINKETARERAERNWPMWRILLSDMNISYGELNSMDRDDLAEANAALDIHIEAMEKQMDDAKKRT